MATTSKKTKARRGFIAWLTGPHYFFGKPKKKQDSDPTMPQHSGDSLDDIYLFDFMNFASQYSDGSVSQAVAANNTFTFVTGQPTDVTNPTDVDQLESSPVFGQIVRNGKIKVKPKDVLNELETVPTPFSLLGIDSKLAVLRDKEKLIRQYYAKREITALIERMENRKKYNAHRSFFDGYQNTTDEKIDALLSKYELVMKAADIFIPEFPDDAVQAMKNYTDAMDKVCGKKPVFYVIAEEDKFQKAYKRKDPILLVQSPFGFFWQILGAWDAEMLIMGEL